MQLDSSVRYISGIGETRAKAFEKAGVFTVRDLLEYFPRRYENRGETRKLFDLPDGETASVVVRIDSSPKEGRGKSGKYYVRVSSSDDTGTLYMTFFNQKWIAKTLSPGRVFRVYGKISMGQYGRDAVNPALEPYIPGMKGIYPVYQLSGALGRIGSVGPELLDEVGPVHQPSVFRCYRLTVFVHLGDAHARTVDADRSVLR